MREYGIVWNGIIGGAASFTYKEKKASNNTREWHPVTSFNCASKR
jgi:hypothetical protein